MEDLLLILFSAGITWLMLRAFTKNSMPSRPTNELPFKVRAAAKGRCRLGYYHRRIHYQHAGTGANSGVKMSGRSDIGYLMAQHIEKSKNG